MLGCKIGSWYDIRIDNSREGLRGNVVFYAIEKRQDRAGTESA